jgi:SAM-dependent methyltransferase
MAAIVVAVTDDEERSPMVHPAIAALYAKGGERDRLTREHPLEFERTKALLSARLPETGRVLDIGGGPGLYSSWLAGRGFDVELIDPVPLHVDQARGRSQSGPAFAVRLGDARRLDADDNSIDVALLMGPLYHLVDRAERTVALGEARRVLKPGGMLAATAIGRFAWLCDAAVRDLIRTPQVVESVTSSVTTGLSTQDPGSGSFYAYFHRPIELRDEVGAAGFENVEVMAIEGFGHLLQDLDRRMADPESRPVL